VYVIGIHLSHSTTTNRRHISKESIGVEATMWA
jgi:hypothetical protein